MEILLEQLRDNKRLYSLNISYNNLIDGFSGNNMKIVLEMESKVKDHLFSFLRVDKKLVHLDLTATNLSENAILHILPAIRVTKALQGVHLSGNPGVTETTKNEIKSLLKARTVENSRRINLLKCLEPATIKAYESTWLREAVKIKHINNGKRIVQNGSTEDKFIDIGSKLILSRYLNHKQDIPGAGQWQLITDKQDHCWICDHEMRGYVFWHRSMAGKSSKLMKINAKE